MTDHLLSSDVRLYHTATSLPGGDIVVFGGRSSPLNPVSGLVRLAVEPFISPDPDGDTVRLHVENMMCTGAPPAARWRHAAAVVDHSGETQTCAPVLHKPSSVITPLALSQLLA